MDWPRMPSRFDKVVSFTVAADRDQAYRWGAAAAEKCMEVASRLADTADSHPGSGRGRDRHHRSSGFAIGSW